MVTNEELKAKLNELKNQVKANSTDARFADKLVDDIVSVKGQLSIEPTKVHIPVKNVLATYDYNHYKVLKLTNGYMFSARGYKIIVGVENQSALFQALATLCDYEEKKATVGLSEEESDILDAISFSIDSICGIPLFAFTSDECTLAHIEVQQTHLMKITGELVDSDLQQETPIEDVEFQKEIIHGEEVLKELKK